LLDKIIKQTTHSAKHSDAFSAHVTYITHFTQSFVVYFQWCTAFSLDHVYEPEIFEFIRHVISLSQITSSQAKWRRFSLGIGELQIAKPMSFLCLLLQHLD
jgi:hypothetical protein